MCSSCSPPANHVIAGLPDEVRQRWLPHLERVDLPKHLALHESGRPMSYAYFPTTAIVSIVYETEAGESTEVALIGNEGLVGIELLLGGGSMPNRAVVTAPGEAFRLPARILQDEVVRAGAASQLLLRYTLALTTLVAQSAVCNRHHSLHERLSRWLLQNLDRGQGNEVVATHEQIANALGARREGVTAGALMLASLGLIRYARGRIEVLDRKGLERQVCECYLVVRNEFTRLLPEWQPTPQPAANLLSRPFTQPLRTRHPLPQ